MLYWSLLQTGLWLVFCGGFSVCPTQAAAFLVSLSSGLLQGCYQGFSEKDARDQWKFHHQPGVSSCGACVLKPFCFSSKSLVGVEAVKPQKNFLLLLGTFLPLCLVGLRSMAGIKRIWLTSPPTWHFFWKSAQWYPVGKGVSISCLFQNIPQPSVVHSRSQVLTKLWSSQNDTLGPWNQMKAP